MKYILVVYLLFFFCLFDFNPFNSVRKEDVYENNSWDYLLFVELWPPSWGSDVNTTFTIHGIWPERWDGSYPEWCNSSVKFNISKLAPIRYKLQYYWTDFKNPERFWYHEYMKHASCSLNDYKLNEELKFFVTGLHLHFNMSTYNILKDAGIYPSNTKCYPKYLIKEAIKNRTGFEPILVCEKYNELTEIMHCYNKNLELIKCPKSAFKQECKSFEINYLN